MEETKEQMERKATLNTDYTGYGYWFSLLGCPKKIEASVLKIILVCMLTKM